MGNLTFNMGKFPAELPGELLYCRNHMWCRPGADGVCRFGFSSYALRLMQDVYFLDWSVNVGDTVQLKQAIGNIETSKAVSDLFAPVAGELVAINTDLLKDPSGINVDNHGTGWLFALRCEPAGTMDVKGYYEFLEKGWENTQRLLKGQMGD